MAGVIFACCFWQPSWRPAHAPVRHPISQLAKVSPDEVRVQVARVGFDDETGSNYVLLLDDTESRMLPIMIGESEATAILLALHGIKPERPFTHDLIRSIIGKTGNSVDRIEIADMRDEIYYATIYMDGGRYTIDSRPSDAIALAMNMNAPIYVNTKLFESAPAIGLGGGGKIPDTAQALGLTVEQLTPDLASAFGEPGGRGVLVSEVDSSAKKAGVARGDIVVKVGKNDVKALDDFNRQVCERQERRCDVDSESRRLEPHRHAGCRRRALGARDSHQLNRMLGACGHAQAARMAFVGANRERLAIAMHPCLHPRNQRHRALVIVAQFAHLEDVVRASLDAIFLGLASRAVDHRRENAARLLLAFRFR